MPHHNPSVQPEDAPKIIFVRQQFSAFGGAELILDRTLEALGARGHKVALLGRSWREDRSNIGFIRCDPPKVARSLRETTFARAACRTLKHYPHSLVQSQEKISCCDIFRTDDGIHAAFLDALKRRNKFSSFFLKLSLYHHNKLSLERKMFASARLKAVIAISKMVADDLVRHYAYPRERIHHIPNGIDLDRFHPSLRRHRTGMRRKLDVPDDYHVVLFVGTGFSRKGLDVAIDAVARLKNRAELWVVGRDRRPNHYLSLANKAGLSGRYRYFGPQADPLPWYGAADVTILPSSYEPFGLTALESMACGVPSVVSKHCGVREVVEQFDPALVCNADNTDEVVQALELALDMAFRPEISERIRATAKRYGLDQMIERSIRLYAELQN